MAYTEIYEQGKFAGIRTDGGRFIRRDDWNDGDYQQWAREQLADIYADREPTVEERRAARIAENDADYLAHMRAGALTSEGFRVSMDWGNAALQSNLAMIDREVLPSLPAKPADLTPEQWAALAQVDAYVIDINGKSRLTNRATLLQEFARLETKRLANLNALRAANHLAESATTDEEFTAATYVPISFDE